MTEPTDHRLLLETTAGPHIVQSGLTTRSMMRDVLIALLPPVAAAIWLFRLAAVQQLCVCLVSALVCELAGCRLRRRPSTLGDGSVTITAVILALSLPPLLPWHAAVAGTVVAVVIGKLAFGGLGQNVFNPAMVGRAFLMLAMPLEMTRWAEPLTVHATTQATPLAAARFSGTLTPLQPLFLGNVPGSLGETSALALLIGGAWLFIRQAADWRLTAGMLAGVAVTAFLQTISAESAVTPGVLHHLLSGSVLFAALFIVTDPVTSPLTRSGRWVFGLAAGILTVVIRWFGGYPEGVMFSILLANALVPIINQVTSTVPVGGRVRHD